MRTLPDPKHEAFATLRASGHDVASAYVHAGYSVKNIKQRSRKLLKNPDIQARIAHLKTCLPRIEELHAHHCPSLRLMPETRHEMLVWLWQVMNGTRLIKPAQMRAATLYCRMRGWHLAKLLPTEAPATSATTQAPAPASVPATAKNTLTESEEVLLAMISVENIKHETTGTLIPQQKLERFQSLMADHAHACCRITPLGIPIPAPAPETPSQTNSSATPTPVPSSSPSFPASPNVPISPAPVAALQPAIHTQPQAPALQPGSPLHAPNPRPLAPASPPASPSQPSLPQRLSPTPSPAMHKFLSPPFLPFAKTVPDLLPGLLNSTTPLPFPRPAKPEKQVHPVKKRPLQFHRPHPAQRPLQLTSGA